MTEFDRDLDVLSIAALHELDALCDGFEQALLQDPNTRIESFITDMAEPQQRLIVRELVQLEIERRHTAGRTPSPDEFAERFPQWADELRELAVQRLDDLDRSTDTINQTALANNDTKTSRVEQSATWADEWRASKSSRSWADLPADGALGHYQLQSEIGRGGMGLVVRAHDTKLTRDVALKVLASTFSHDDTAHERFLREARAAAVVRHTHVVTIYAVEEVDRIPFLVMELVDGTTLEEYLRTSGKLPTAEVVSIASQMAQGLAAAHKQSLIHRDIKPANILLEKTEPRVNGPAPLSNWHVKITDFGLARVAAEAQLTNSGLIAGTPQYMSPEQANGQELDARSDLFSLGSVMYEMCAGRAAFEADSAIAIVRQVADQPARSLREVSRETPDWLNETIEKLMAKSPYDRFQSAGEVAELLDRHLHDVPTSSSKVVAKMMANAEPAPTPIAAPRLLRQRQFAVALCALLMIAPIGLFIAQVVFRVETPQGMLIVKTDDPDVQISVKSGGTEVALFFPGQQKEIPLKIGEYTIELVKGRNGLKLSTNKFEIQSGQDQTTVTVEFEPAVVAGTDPPTVEKQATVANPPKVTEQAKAVDVEKPFAWPEGHLWHGRIAAPDFSQAKELYRDDFASPETTWPIVKSVGCELGLEQGTYFIKAAPALVQGAWVNDKTYTNFACQVVGRVRPKGNEWYLNYTSVTNEVTVRFHLNCMQHLSVSILNDGPPRNAHRIRHTALKQGEEFDKLLVVAVGNRFEIFANDVAICDPFVLDEIKPPGRLALGVVASRVPARAEFKSCTIWSAEGLPTPEERLARGAPYNRLPAPAKPKQVDTPIPPDPPPAIAP